MILTEKQLLKRVEKIRAGKAKPVSRKEFINKKLYQTKENFLAIACCNPTLAAHIYAWRMPKEVFSEEDKTDMFWTVAKVLADNDLFLEEKHTFAVPDTVRQSAEFLMLPINGRPLPIHHEMVKEAFEKLTPKKQKMVLLNYITKANGVTGGGCIGIEYKTEVLENAEYILTLFPKDADIHRAIAELFPKSKEFMLQNFTAEVKYSLLKMYINPEIYTTFSEELRANPYLAELYLEHRKEIKNGSYGDKSNYIYMPYVSMDEVKVAKSVGVSKGYDVTDDAIKNMVRELKQVYYGYALSETVPMHYWKIKKFVKQVLPDYPQAIAPAYDTGAYNEADILEFAKINGMILQYLPNIYTGNVDIVLECIKSAPESYLFANKELQCNESIYKNMLTLLYRVKSEIKKEQIVEVLLENAQNMGSLMDSGERTDENYHAVRKLIQEKLHGKNEDEQVKEFEMVSSAKFEELCRLSEK